MSRGGRLRINFLKLKPKKWLFVSLFTLLILPIGFYYLGNLTVLNSLLLCVCCVLIAVTLLVLIRWKIYINYLKQIGEEVDRNRFYDSEHIVSMVPFKKLLITVHARMDDSALLIKKANCYIAINFENIDSFEPTEYLGHPVAKVVLIENKSLESPLYVPWSEEMAQHKVFHDGI